MDELNNTNINDQHDLTDNVAELIDIPNGLISAKKISNKKATKNNVTNKSSKTKQKLITLNKVPIKEIATKKVTTNKVATKKLVAKNFATINHQYEIYQNEESNINELDITNINGQDDLIDTEQELVNITAKKISTKKAAKKDATKKPREVKQKLAKNTVVIKNFAAKKLTTNKVATKKLAAKSFATMNHHYEINQNKESNMNELDNTNINDQDDLIDTEPELKYMPNDLITVRNIFLEKPSHIIKVKKVSTMKHTRKKRSTNKVIIEVEEDIDNDMYIEQEDVDADDEADYDTDEQQEKRNISSTELASPEELEFLKIMKSDEDMPDSGWISRNLNDYHKILPNNLKNCKDDDKIAKYVKDRMIHLNHTIFKRKVYKKKSRYPFNSIPYFLTNSIRELFFKSSGDIHPYFNECIKNSVYTTIIAFEGNNKCKNDLRIQVHLKESNFLNNIKECIYKSGIVNRDLEIIDDVSLLIGGKINQPLHGDHNRLFTYFNQDIHHPVGHEVNREKYNTAVSSDHAQSSILIDLSNDQSGFYLTLPIDKVIYDKVKGRVTILDHKIDDVVFKYERHSKTTVTFLVKDGCQFVGDYIHAGANNLKKLNKFQNDLFDKWYSTISNNRKDGICDQGIVNEFLEMHPWISTVTRFFCKTIPISFKDDIPKESIYYPTENGKRELYYYESDSESEKQRRNSNRCSRPIPIKYKHFNPKPYSKIIQHNDHDVTIKTTMKTRRAKIISGPITKNRLSAQKQQQLQKKKKNFIHSTMIAAFPIKFHNLELLVTEEAFNEYFNLDDYKNKINNSNNNKNTIPIIIKALWNKIKACVHVSQMQWQLSINRNVHLKQRFYSPIDIYSIDFEFPEWRSFECNDSDQVPLVQWLMIKDSIAVDGQIGVYAARNFVKGEVIGLFYGKSLDSKNKNKIPSKYALKTRHGIYDPERGVTDSGRDTFMMGMHLVKKVDDKILVNATISCHCLVMAIRDIMNGEEILYKNDDDLFFLSTQNYNQEGKVDGNNEDGNVDEDNKKKGLL